jgi:hypothetical protein
VRVWALWRTRREQSKLIGLYESYDDAQAEKDALMDEGAKLDPPPSCSVIAMETIPAKVKEEKDA